MEIATYISGLVTAWEEHRRSQYDEKWLEYYRLWRGIWRPQDKTRDSERSRLITPGLQQAIEATVAEFEEATFGRERWVDIEDNKQDEDSTDVSKMNTQLLEDFELDNVPGAIAEAFLNGALYGTGIAKAIVDEERELALVGNDFGPQMQEVNRVQVKWAALEPFNFAIDPAATTIQNAFGVAHIMVAPLHTIKAKQAKGVYSDGDLGGTPEFSRILKNTEKGEFTDIDASSVVKIVDYHGLVPKHLLEKDDDEFFDFGFEDATPIEIDEEDMVEAIVLVANDTFVLKATQNPNIMRDRGFIAYQHDTVPGRFWGRGVAEKGFNMQKATDAEMRARIDGLAFSTNPMMGIQATSVPRGQKMGVYPGKTILTTGNPRDELFPVTFPPPDANTYRHMSDLERMLQMGTGAMDSSAPVGISPRNSTASGMSMMAAGAIKRQKRTMQNIERNFLDPLVRKSLWRYMQFDPQRYPTADYKFVIHSTMGIMAREFEQQQLSNLLNTVPTESPAYWMLLDSIYQNSSIENREEMRGLIQKMLETVMNPQKPQPSPADELAFLKLKLASSELEYTKEIDSQRLQLEHRRVDVQEEQARSNTVLKSNDQIVEIERQVYENMESKSLSVLNIVKAQAESLNGEIARAREIAATLPQHQVVLAQEDPRIAQVLESVSALSGSQQALLEAQTGLGSQQAGLAAQVGQMQPGISVEQMNSAIAGIPQQQQLPAQPVDTSGMDALAAKIEALSAAQSEPKRIKVKRNAKGVIQSVNGREPVRNSQGLIEEI